MYIHKAFKDYTLEDAMKEYENGFDVICNDGAIRLITNEDRLDE